MTSLEGTELQHKSETLATIQYEKFLKILDNKQHF